MIHHDIIPSESSTELAESKPQVPARTMETEHERFSRFLPKDYLSSLTPRQKEALDQVLAGISPAYLKPGASPTVLICAGPHCPYVLDKTGRAWAKTNESLVVPEDHRDLSRCRCPLYDAGVEPLNHPCPIESHLVDNIVQDVIDDMGEDRSKRYMTQIRKLAVWEVIFHRASSELAVSGQPLINVYDSTGEGDKKKIYVKDRKENPLIGVAYTAQQNIVRIRQSLGLFRASRADSAGPEDTAGALVAQALKAGAKKIGIGIQIGDHDKVAAMIEAEENEDG